MIDKKWRGSVFLQFLRNGLQNLQHDWEGTVSGVNVMQVLQVLTRVLLQDCQKGWWLDAGITSVAAGNAGRRFCRRNCSRVSEGQLVPRENCTELPQKLRRSTNCAGIGGQIAGFAEREGVAGFAEILQRFLQLRLQNLRFVISVKKVKGDLLSCYFWSQNSIFLLSTLATSDSVVQLF